MTQKFFSTSFVKCDKCHLWSLRHLLILLQNVKFTMKKTFLFAILIGGLLAVKSCGGSESTDAEATFSEADEKLLKQAQGFFKPLPEAKSFDRPIAALGRKLYFENALSITGDMSCNSCHMLDKFGVDNEATSPGHDGTRGDRNSPTVYNAYFHIAQFWDGRAADLFEQAKGPILNPIEMGMPDEASVKKAIEAIEAYKPLFAAAFPDDPNPINFDNIALAIAEFEHTLATPAPFDDYLNGDLSALTDKQRKGLQTFINTGCITCHMGPGLGGQMFHKFGLINGQYWDFTGSKKIDEGRYAVTNNESDKYFFKVPSLRNVEKTHPYFHDGSVADLHTAVKIMAKTQNGRDLELQEIQEIVDFLSSLTGSIPTFANN
jgi:cytochrome c peroxidase